MWLNLSGIVHFAWIAMTYLSGGNNTTGFASNTREQLQFENCWLHWSKQVVELQTKSKYM